MRCVRLFVYCGTVALLLLLAGVWLLGMPGAAPAPVQAAGSETGMTTLSLAHYAPFDTELISTSVSIHIQNGPVYTDVVFGDKVSGLVVPAGVYTVEVALTGTVTPVLTAAATLSEGVETLLAVIGGPNGWPLEMLALPGAATAPTATAQVRVSHLSPFMPLLAATAVDVCTQDGTPVPGLTGLVYGQSTAFTPLPPGLYDLKVTAGGSACGVLVLDLPVVQLAPGQTVDLFGIGLPGDPNLPFRIDGNGLRARAALGHFAPFAGEVISTAVTVRLGASEVVSNFVYGQITPYVELPLGDLPVEIIPSGAVTPVMTGTAVISGYMDYTFAAIGDQVNQPLELIRLLDDNATPPPAGKGRLRLAHLAPIAANLPATSVDLCNAADNSVLVDNLTYRQSATLLLDAGVQRVYVSAGALNCLIALQAVPPFAIGDGQIANAYAIGNLVFQPPSVVVVPDLSLRYQYLPLTTR